MKFDESITIEATVTRFIKDAMCDHYSSSKYASFDAVELQVSQPSEWKGKSLVVYLAPDSSGRETLCEPNARLRFTIERGYLAADRMLFDGALSNLVKIDS